MKPQHAPSLAEQIAGVYGHRTASGPLPDPFRPRLPPGRATGPKPASEQEEREQLEQLARAAYR